VWWALLVVLITAIIWSRHNDLLAGRATAFDALAFVIWVSLLLAPVFSELKFIGLEFKQKFDDLKRHFDTQMMTIRSDIRNSVDIRPQFTISTPPPDTQLPSLEGQIRPIIEETLKAFGVQRDKPVAADAAVPADAQFLFSIRYTIEKELRQLWKKPL
jgi:hypothetical protein